MCVSVFGDSFANNGSEMTFPRKIAKDKGLKVRNFAKIGATASDLPQQLAEWQECTDSGEIAICHVGGNNLLLGARSFEQTETTYGPMICEKLKELMHGLSDGNVKYVIVCGVPFTTTVPAFKDLVKAWADEHGKTHEEGEDMARTQSKILNDMTKKAMHELSLSLRAMKFVFFNEVDVIKQWPDDFFHDGLHPNSKGHAQLAEVVGGLWDQEGFPGIGRRKRGPSHSPSHSSSKRPKFEPKELPRIFDAECNADSLPAVFAEACAAALRLRTVAQGDMLKLYALYKQGSVGDNEAPRPSFIHYKERTKWDAWNKVHGTDPDAAKREYIKLYNECAAENIPV